MALRQYHSGYWIQKARKPKWQDPIPWDDLELRETYKIAAKHTKTFASAFLKMNRELIDEDVAKNIRKIWRAGGSVQDVMNAIPLFSPGATDDMKVWRDFARKMQRAYEKTIQEAGQYSTEMLNRSFRTKFQFTTESKAPETMRGVVPAVPVVPVNPYSVKWMADRSLQLVEQNVTAVQRDVIQRALTKAFERGLRAESVVKEIQNNIGLTDKWYKAVDNYRDRLITQQVPKERAEQLVDKYRGKLLRRRAERIARTETIDAEAHGRKASWQMAQDSGQLPAVERVWISAPASPNPSRPCEACLEMDGKRAPVNGTYESLFYGAVVGPTLHPD